MSQIINSLPYTGHGVDADGFYTNTVGIKVPAVWVGASGSENEIFSSAAGQRCMKRVAFGATELAGTEVNTSFAFPAGGAILHNAFIYVGDAEGGGSMDVGTQGTSNDPDGILDGISLASTGFVFPTATLTVGLNGTYISATTFGALSHKIDIGSDAAGDAGLVTPMPTLITGADPVSITASGDLNSCSGYLYLDYTALGATS